MLWAIVMAGGSGTRLWPLSRRKKPKPLLKLIPGKATLLEETLARLTSAVPPNRIWVIGNREHLSTIRKVSRNIPASQIIGEPVSRNTLATVGLGASLILERDPNGLILFVPADHWIRDTKKFQQTVRLAARSSERTKAFSIFGVKPRFPSTSYGYLESGKKIAPSVYRLSQFVEKPSLKRARAFLRASRFYWHAGIFLAPAKTVMSSIRHHAPTVEFLLRKLAVHNGKVGPIRVFSALPNISMDYAVLERLTNAHLVRADFDWCDVGTWNSFEDIWPKDRFENSVVGSCFALNSERNIVYSKEKLVCLQGVKDLVVIDTPDALLVSRKDAAEEMRRMVVHLSKNRSLARHS